MANFHYYEPASVAEAQKLALDLGDDATFVAGGTDIVVRLNKGRFSCNHIININKISELNFIQEEDGAFRIGAATKLADILASEKIRAQFPAFYRGVEAIGTPQIRNRGTLGGNICNASPCADSVPPLVCLGATIIVASDKGDKEMDIRSFLLGPGKTALQKGELVKAIRIPSPDPEGRYCFLKLGPRRTADIAVVNLGASVALGNGICRSARIALGSVAPTVLCAVKAEAMLEGQKPEQLDFAEIGKMAAEEARPISDQRASLEYRKETVAVLVERGLRSLLY